MPDRQNVVIDMTAKGDEVWAIWRVVGHHVGDWYGIPGTGRFLDVLEAGMWRIEDGLIADGWFFGDDSGCSDRSGCTPATEPRSGVFRPGDTGGPDAHCRGDVNRS